MMSSIFSCAYWPAIFISSSEKYLFIFAYFKIGLYFSVFVCFQGTFYNNEITYTYLTWYLFFLSLKLKQTFCLLGKKACLMCVHCSAILKKYCNFNFRTSESKCQYSLFFIWENKCFWKIIWSLDKISVAISLRSLSSLHDSEDTKETSNVKDIPAHMISSTRRMLVVITVQEWKSCFFTQ